MNLKNISKYKWKILPLITIIPVLFFGLVYEHITKKDAQQNGEIVEVKIKKISCGSGKRSAYKNVLYMEKIYRVGHHCGNEKIGDIIKTKYSKKYDVMVTTTYRNVQGMYAFFYVCTILLFLMFLHDLCKNIKSSDSMDNSE